MKTAILRTIYVYDCDECGTENLVRPIRCEMTDEDREEMAINGMPLEGEWVMMPDKTTCKECKTTFLTMDAMDDTDDN